MHLLITLFLCGFWLPIWILASIKIGGWRCQTCGYRGSMASRLVAPVVCVLLLFVAVGVIASRPPRESAPVVHQPIAQQQPPAAAIPLPEAIVQASESTQAAAAEPLTVQPEPLLPTPAEPPAPTPAEPRVIKNRNDRYQLMKQPRHILRRKLKAGDNLFEN